ncbi:MAG: cyclic nucleotide-binding domain-containing protein [Nitrospinae bacterium]|nr:cyclic nucleotide-binding domain-containing protein [Nitrospinota bacterium]
MLKTLKSMDFFRVFSKEDMREIARFCQEYSQIKEWREDERIIQEAEQDFRVFFLLKGKVVVNKEGKTVAEFSRRGDLFGEMSALDRSARSASVEAGPDCQTLALDITLLGKFLPELFCKFKTEFQKIAVARLRQTTAAVEKRMKELEEINAALKKEIARRERAEKNLAQARSFVSLSLMAASIAHEMRQPLSAADVDLATVLEDLDGEPKQLVKGVKDNIKEALLVIRSMMKMFRGRKKVSAEVDLNEELEEVLHLIARKTKGVEIVRNFDEDVQTWTCANLSRVFVNIVDNALDALKNQGRLKLSTYAGADHLAVEIEDDGLGIAEDILPSIFNPECTTKKSGEGTGLGLWIAKQEMDWVGGKIIAESVEGLFTKFTIIIPRHTSEECGGCHREEEK